MPAAKDIAQRIAGLRRARGWKQKELAARIDSTLHQVSKMERGRYLPRAATLVRLAAAFGVSVDYLLTGPPAAAPAPAAADAAPRHPVRPPRPPAGDPRLRDRLHLLERLPKPQRDSLVLFLDALIAANGLSEGGRSGPGGAGEPRG